jgi:hypothetical protein
MKLFSYKKPQKEMSVEAKINESTDFLKLSGCGDFIVNVKKYISITPTSFSVYYQSVIDETVNLLQALPDKYDEKYNVPYGLLQATCQRTLIALRRKKNKLLPPRSDAETIKQQEDHWVYAIFIASMTRDLWKVMGFDLSLPSTKIGEVKLFDPLTQLNKVSYCNAREKSEPLGAYSNMSLSFKRIPERGVEFLKYFKLVWDQLLTYWDQRPSIFAQFIDNVDSQTTIVKNDQLLPLLEEIETSYKDRFVYWFQHAQDKSFKINEKSSDLYLVEAGILVVGDKLFDLFIIEEGIFKKTASDIKHELTKEKFLISNNNRSDRLYRYYEGEWADGNELLGILIKTEDIFKSGQTPTLSGLRRDRD